MRDYDFQLSPVLATLAGRRLLFGAGKAGIVVAWDRATHRRVWTAAVGVHRADSGPLPRHRTTVCPGLLGGVETPMAYAAGRLFVPVVDLCMRGSAVGYEDLAKVDIARRARGELVALDAASGTTAWVRRFPHAVFGCATVANGVVFTATFDGTLYALDASDGAPLWTGHASAGRQLLPCPGRIAAARRGRRPTQGLGRDPDRLLVLEALTECARLAGVSGASRGAGRLAAQAGRLRKSRPTPLRSPGGRSHDRRRTATNAAGAGPGSPEVWGPCASGTS